MIQIPSCMKEMTAVQTGVVQMLTIRNRISHQVIKRDGNAAEKVPIFTYASQVADLHI